MSNEEAAMSVSEETPLESLLELYQDLLQEPFPLRLCQSMEEAQLKEIIADSIVAQVPYKPDSLPEILY